MSLTTFAGAPVLPPFSWSYSRLDAYKTCPKKFYHAQIKKDFPERQSDEMLWGNQVHQALAKRIMHDTPLPAGMAHWEKWAKWAIGDEKPALRILKCEQQLAVTEDMKACGYFDKRVPVWFRTVADVLKVRGNVARLIDWKTGNKKEGSDQIDLCAATLMIHYPEVQHVLCQFAWLKDDIIQENLISRSDIPRVWGRALPEVNDMRASIETGNFPAKPSGLCVRHCAVTSCAYYKKGNR